MESKDPVFARKHRDPSTSLVANAPRSAQDDETFQRFVIFIN